MEQNNINPSNPVPSQNNPAIAAMSFINPDQVISQLDFQSGMKIADFGCGTGFFVFPLAKRIGTAGVIYAFDILKEKLEAVESQAKLMGLGNIICRRTNLEVENSSMLEPETIDWVLLINMLYENNDIGKNKIIEETKRVLKPGGSVMVIEWSPSAPMIGPDVKLRVSKDLIVSDAAGNGLALAKELPISNYHYCLIFTKK